ncbi:MAG TPA: hypothetical protein VGB87_14005 [Vicinamibacteria bacterium]
MRRNPLSLTLLALVASSAATALAQGVPTTQPKFMHVFRETVKPGRAAEHAKWEAGWPAAFEKAKSPYHYIALQSITGPPEVWYVSPLASQAAYGEMVAEEQKDPVLAAELDRLAKGDGEFLAEQSALQAAAVPELSHGAFPAIGKMRYYEISTFRIRPGHRAAWMAATKAYKAAAARSAPGASWRTYDVVAGAPDGTYLIFSSVGSFAEFDRMMAEGEATMKGATAEETGVLEKFMKESVISVSTQRYRLDPGQSYVNAETKAQDPAFWAKKP